MLVVRLSLIACVVAASFAGPAIAGDAGARLQRAIESAWQSAPEMARAEASIEVARRQAASLSGGLAPYLEFQREGMIRGFDDASNATQFLRLGTTFSTLGQRRAGRELVGTGTNWSRDALRAARWEGVGATARLWLDVALAEERVAVLQTQNERLGRALMLERKRLELGEVAGADVLQLELEEARIVAELALEQSARGRLQAELARWSPDASSAPLVGDLAQLRADARGELPDPNVLSGMVDSSPAVVAARRSLDMQRSRTELTSRSAFGRPTVELEWERVPELSGAPAFDAWGLLLNVPLPLGRSGLESRRAGLARVRAEESSYEIARRHALADARGHLTAAQHAEATLARLEPVFAKLERTESTLGERFRLGSIDYLVLIDGLGRLDEVRLERARTLHTLLAARLELVLLGAEARVFELPILPEVAGPEPR